MYQVSNVKYLLIPHKTFDGFINSNVWWFYKFCKTCTCTYVHKNKSNINCSTYSESNTCIKVPQVTVTVVIHFMCGGTKYAGFLCKVIYAKCSEKNSRIVIHTLKYIKWQLQFVIHFMCGGTKYAGFLCKVIYAKCSCRFL